jgi:hypothetical protein
MGAHTKGVRNAEVTFDRDIPAVLLQEIEWHYLPGREPTILNDGEVKVSSTLSQYCDRMSALSEFLDGDKNTWVTDPHRLLFLLAEKVFKGFRRVNKFRYEKRSVGAEAPLNPTVIRWYQRSVELRRAGIRKQEALRQAGAEFFPEIDADSVLTKFRRIKHKGGPIDLFEHLIKEHGLDKAAGFILAFSVDKLLGPGPGRKHHDGKRTK